jgi:hypothetical protein
MRGETSSPSATAAASARRSRIRSLDPDAVLAFVIDNCSITRTDRIDNGGSGFWRIATVNHRPWMGDTLKTTASGVMA